MVERRPSIPYCGAVSAALIAAVLVHNYVHVATGGNSWRAFISQTPITPAWWADAALQLLAFLLQVSAVVYIWVPTGYSIDQKKTVLIETVGLAWIAQWLSLIAADVLHLAMGSSPAALVGTSLVGSLAGFAALYACLRRIHPLTVRMRKQEELLRDPANTMGLVRRGTRWATAYCLFRLPTAISAGLCAVRLTADSAAFAVAALAADFRAAVNPSLGLLLAVMVLGVVMLNQLDEVAFTLTVLLWLAGLIAASHTLLVVKGFCIALVLALAMRAAFKYVPEEDDDAATAAAVKAKRRD